MKFLVAIVLFALAVAEASHVPKHNLRGVRFEDGYTYKYDMALNVTAGVLGMSSQVSASVLRAVVKIRATSRTEHVLKISNIRVSESVAAIDNKYGDIPLSESSGLKDKLSLPIKFVLENGKVTRYTLSPQDNLESKKIKRSILRSLEMYVPEYIMTKMEERKHANQPIMYNTTENTEYGSRIYNYLITASPNVEFPKETIVYNISQFDNSEGEWYPGHKLHHNFQKQGCPEVCRPCGEWSENFYGAGCPSGFEPQHSPIKRSFNHQHSLSPVGDTLSPDVITTVEVHYAKLYDQDMEVLFRFRMQRREAVKERAGNEFDIRGSQNTFTDLQQKDMELNENEIDEVCNYKKSEEAVEPAKTLLEEIADLIEKGEPSSPIGEKIILFRDILSRFIVSDFQKFAVERNILPVSKLQFEGGNKQSIKRQVWLDILPLVGTQESVKFIVKYMTEELKKVDKSMLVWEAKEILEALPQNIERPDEDTITEIEKLMSIRLFTDNALLHSAVHVSMGRIIGEICGNAPLIRSEENKQRSSPKGFQSAHDEKKGLPVCPEEKVIRIIKDISKKMKDTTEAAQIVVYIEALSLTGMQEAVWEINDYAHGTARNLQQFTPRHRTFLRTSFLHALHNIVENYPEEVMEIVLPMYFNETESPKIRNSAFGVLIRCQPSLAILERVATQSWFEKSREVGSYVTSTLETFGNSTLPCMQLLSHRITEILPQVKRFNNGLQHAKNLMWPYFDELRMFGLEGRLEYIPNNESFVPSTLYHSLSYTMDSLKDFIYKGSLNIEGVTHEKILEKVIKYLNIGSIEPLSNIAEIFGQDEQGMKFMQARAVEDLRLVTTQKLFYKTSFYYLDARQLQAAKVELFKVFDMYLKTRKHMEYSGYFVKVLLPSSYHTVSVAKTLPYPVEFQMKQPIVFSMEIKTPKGMTDKPSPRFFDLQFKPSIHLSKIFTHQVKNLRDCKEVGVYHTHKIGMTYPFQLKYSAQNIPKIVLRYKVPELKNKNVLYYFTEAGTYAGKKDMINLPMHNGVRTPILTLPTPFKFEKTVSLVGVPPFRIEAHSEDINLFHQKMPKTLNEGLDMAVRNILNAGWRYKSANITIIEDRTLWNGENEATFTIDYEREHVNDLLSEMSRSQEERQKSAWDRQSRSSGWQAKESDSQIWRQNSKQSDDEHWTTETPWDSDDSLNARQSEYEDWNTESPTRRQMSWNLEKESPSDSESWYKYMKSEGEETMEEFASNAEAAARILIDLTPHIRHTLKISVKAEPLVSTASIFMDYNHTYDKTFHKLLLQAVSQRASDSTPRGIRLHHLVGYVKRPDEMKYGDGFGKQIALFRSALDWSEEQEKEFIYDCGFEKVEIAGWGFWSYASNKDVLQPLLLEEVDDKYFLPETREKCLRDVNAGNPLSTDCIKAIREHSAFNKMHMGITWEKNLPQKYKQLARETDAYLKHYFFEHMHLKAENNNRNGINIKMTYIDKFVDEPVADWEIRKPTETLTLHKIPIKKTHPLSSVYTMNEASLLRMTNNTYPAQCMLTDKYVRTYDLVSYPFEAKRSCYYVLSAHCTNKKYFAVLLHESKEVHIHVGHTTLVLLPTRESSYRIKHDDQEITVTTPVIFDPEDDIFAYIEWYGTHQHLRVVAKKAGFNVLYDGNNVKIQVSPRYKGELCGLCSEFDGEALREFRGMDQCLYTDHRDFADSNLVKRSERCAPEKHIHGQKFCENPKLQEFRGHSDTRTGEEPSLQRNAVLYRGDEVCFSVRPLAACDESAEPSETESQRIGFHCLPKDDLTAMKMITEAEWRVLDELRRKSVDRVETIEVPKMC